MSFVDQVEVDCEVVGETELAWEIDDGDTEVWLPKSQTEWLDDEGIMMMPEWLALEKGLI